MLLQHEGMRLTLQIIYIMLITSMLLNFCNFAIFEHEIDFRDFHRKETAVKYDYFIKCTGDKTKCTTE